MPNPPIPDSQKAINAGISLPSELIRLLAKDAFSKGKSKSALANEIFRKHFRLVGRNAKRRKNTRAVK